MSLIGARLGAYTAAECLVGSSRSRVTVPFTQRRGLKGRVKISKKHRHKGIKDSFVEESKQKPQTRATVSFLPIPVNQLKAPIFNSETRPVLSLPVFKPSALTPSAVGTAMEFDKTKSNILASYGVPRNILVDFRLLSKPCSVVRDITLKTIAKLNAASEKSSSETRAVLTGPRGCGKSVLLLQAVEYCATNGWVVIYIPRGVNLVNSSTQYIYDARTRTYLQPTFSYQLLERFARVNAKILDFFKIKKEFKYGSMTFREGTPLSHLAAHVVEADQMAAPAILNIILTQLGQQKKYPVLLAVDDFQALYCHTTLYRDARFEGIKPYHLSLPRLILEYASGKKHFERGAVLGALSPSQTAFKLPLELSEALRLPYDRPSGPYVRRKPEFVEYAKGLQNIPVPAQLQVKEAASIFEVWMNDNALHSPMTDETFMTTYTEASGNARDFIWKGLLNSFTL